MVVHIQLTPPLNIILKNSREGALKARGPGQTSYCPALKPTLTITHVYVKSTQSKQRMQKSYRIKIM